MHGAITALAILGKTLEKLGIGNEITLYRLMAKWMPLKSKKDSELFIRDMQFEGVRVRVYQPKAPAAGGGKAVVFFHGGGFVVGNIELCDSLCIYMSKASGAIVISVGYRLAPEHRYPAAFDDCLGATIHFLKTAQDFGVNPSSVIICGESAGANLVAAVSQALVMTSDVPKPLAQVLIYPVLQLLDFNLPAHQQNHSVPFLMRDRTPFYTLNYAGGGDLSISKEVLNGSHVPPELRKKFSKWLSADNIPKEFKVRGYKPQAIPAFNNKVYEKVKQVFDPACSPLLAEDSVLCLLQKTYILTCEFDILRDEGILYKQRLEDNGVPVTWNHIKDGFHGIVSFFDQLNSGKQAVDHFVKFIKDV
ncbi:arylacetamide deacetylase-like 4 isoform X2 [Hyperolius riggenbachi]